MTEETLNILEKLKEGKSFISTKDRPAEISELILKLNNLGILDKPTKSKYVADFTSRKYLTKLIELRSWPDFLEWLDKQNTNGNINNDFSGSTVGQVNQSSEKIDLKSPIIQNIKSKTDKEPNKKSLIEIASWVSGVIVGIIAIYEFILKRLII